MPNFLLSKARLKPRSDERVDARRRDHIWAYLQVMYAYSSSCQLRHSQLRHCIVNDVISTGVVSASTRSVRMLPIFNISLIGRVDARRRSV